MTARLWPHYELDTWVDILWNWVALRTSLSAGYCILFKVWGCWMLKQRVAHKSDSAQVTMVPPLPHSILNPFTFLPFGIFHNFTHPSEKCFPILHFPGFYAILGGCHKNVKMEFYCIHNFVTAVYVSRQDIRLTSQWPHVYTTSPPPPTPQQLVYGDTSFPWQVYITSARPAPKHQNICPTYYTPYSKQAVFPGDKITWPNILKVRKQ